MAGASDARGEDVCGVGASHYPTYTERESSGGARWAMLSLSRHDRSCHRPRFLCIGERPGTTRPPPPPPRTETGQMHTSRSRGNDAGPGVRAEGGGKSGAKALPSLPPLLACLLLQRMPPPRRACIHHPKPWPLSPYAHPRAKTACPGQQRRRARNTAPSFIPFHSPAFSPLTHTHPIIPFPTPPQHPPHRQPVHPTRSSCVLVQ